MDELAFVATPSEGVASLWDLKSGSRLSTMKQFYGGAKGFQKLGREFLFSTHVDRPAIHVHSLQSEMPIARLVAPERITSIAVSDNGAAIALATRSGHILVYETATGSLRASFEAHYKSINVVKFSGDSCVLASGSEDSAIHLWSVAELLDAFSVVDGVVNVHRPFMSFAGHTLGVTDMCFGGANEVSRMYSVAHDRTMRIWCMQSESPILTVLFDTALHSVIVDKLENAAYVGGDTGSIFEVDLRRTYPPSVNHTSGNIGREFEGHTGRVHSLSFNMDDTQLLSGSEDNFAKLWDIQTGVCLKTLNPFLQSSKAEGVTTSSSAGTGSQLAVPEARGVTNVAFIPLPPSMQTSQRQVVRMASAVEAKEGYEDEFLTFKSLLPSLLGAPYLWSGIPLKRYKAADTAEIRYHHVMSDEPDLGRPLEALGGSQLEERQALCDALLGGTSTEQVMELDGKSKQSEMEELQRKVAMLEQEKAVLVAKNEELFTLAKSQV
mmetsp:Transcript_45101/g.116641  ORF Transcript_45101/g.116641 Transcript_45101/m.116641 type:complete len:494 (-) Transcript_45101:537-2018(-)